MSASTDPSTSPAAAWLARGISATWWYTAGSVIFLHLTVLSVWGLVIAALAPVWPRPVTIGLFVAGAVVSVGAAIALLVVYRRSLDGAETDRRFSRRGLQLTGLIGSAVSATLLGVVSSSALFGAGLAAFALCLVRWAPGVRLRIVGLVFIALCIIWALEGNLVPPGLPGGPNLIVPIFTILLAPTSVLSLWWWDIVVELNRARAAESRLAAVQERLRLAGDLHDLQGHHLQVIALQLELAERMLPRDPAAAAEQVRLARASVDDARRGTRELASRFRGVPLPDELANAADLLRAAGLEVTLEIAPDAPDAPVDVLRPVIRECTTNVLKHGGGKWARLSLRHTGGSWILRVANDAGTATSTLGAGAGLAGIADRVQAVGGDLDSGAHGDEFDVTVTVPAALAGAREEGTR